MLKNDPNSFFNSVTALQGEMFAYAFSITKSREDAEDAVHNAIIKAFNGLSKLRDKAKLRQWLFRILRNESLLLLRTKKRIVPLSCDIPEECTDDEAGPDLAAAVASLSHELREVVVLYYKLDHSTKEIAKIAGIPRGTVMSRLARARELIKIHLEGGKQ